MTTQSHRNGPGRAITYSVEPNAQDNSTHVSDAPEPVMEESDELYDATTAPSYEILQAANPLPE